MVVPPKHPKMIIFSGIPMGVGYHHFRKPPYTKHVDHIISWIISYHIVYHILSMTFQFWVLPVVILEPNYICVQVRVSKNGHSKWLISFWCQKSFQKRKNLCRKSKHLIHFVYHPGKWTAFEPNVIEVFGFRWFSGLQLRWFWRFNPHD